ncbi:MAG: hypothetical protein ACRDSN_03000, partial [Pseudonocardiaceae bacterium]
MLGFLSVFRGLGQRLQSVERTLDKRPFKLEPLAVAQLVAIDVDVRREFRRAFAVGDGLKQKVDEGVVAAEGKKLVGIALVGVHHALVLEQLGVEAQGVKVR